MSQIYKTLVSGGPVPPEIPTSFPTNDGTAVPAANVLIIDAYDSEENDVNGITAKGGVAAGDPPGAGATNQVSIYLTNRFTGSVNTNDDTPEVLLVSFNLGATPGTYLFRTYVTVFNVTSNLSSAYTFQTCFRTDGATSTKISTGNLFVSEEGAMINAAVGLDNTPANTYTLLVTGLPASVIHWKSLTDFTFVS